MPTYPDRACEYCGKMFTPNRKDKRYCRPKCCDYASAKRTGSYKNKDKNYHKRVLKYRLKRRYNLSEEGWLSLKINGCQICGSMDKLVVDHDHTTGKVCGCLCSSCNKGLGFFRENSLFLESALQYLAKTKKAPKE